VLALPASMLCTSLVFAADAPEVVARIADTSITTSDVERRLASASPGEKSGATSDAARQLLETLLIPEVRASLEAIQRGLDKSPRYAEREREILRQALDQALKAEQAKEKPISPEAIKEYFEANKSRFEQPARVRIWRILVDDEAKAKSLLEEAKRAGSPAKWGELARENSRDTATNLRQGDLGFVHPDGNTDAPRVRVDPALFRAAEQVKDGEFVAQPVKEGGKFAIIWRRGSLPAKSRTLEQEKESIRGLLERKRNEEAHGELLKRLRTQFVRDEHPELLEQIPDGLFASKAPRPRPGLTRRLPPMGPHRPEPTDEGLR
jgi:peptidyl-prolyl cis-trans isomerase C